MRNPSDPSDPLDRLYKQLIALYEQGLSMNQSDDARKNMIAAIIDAINAQDDSFPTAADLYRLAERIEKAPTDPQTDYTRRDLLLLSESVMHLADRKNHQTYFTSPDHAEQFQRVGAKLAAMALPKPPLPPHTSLLTHQPPFSRENLEHAIEAYQTLLDVTNSKEARAEYSKTLATLYQVSAEHLPQDQAADAWACAYDYWKDYYNARSSLGQSLAPEEELTAILVAYRADCNSEAFVNNLTCLLNAALFAQLKDPHSPTTLMPLLLLAAYAPTNSAAQNLAEIDLSLYNTFHPEAFTVYASLFADPPTINFETESVSAITAKLEDAIMQAQKEHPNGAYKKATASEAEDAYPQEPRPTAVIQHAIHMAIQQKEGPRNGSTR